VSEADDAEFQSLIDYVQRVRGFDFGAYKRNSLMRRVQKRMQATSVERFADYVDYLEVHPDEFAHLFNTILINVTEFFRDEAAWETLSRVVIPRILQAKRPDEPIRAWSAGCASGQEAYSIIMLLGEALGEDGLRQRVKIYATDIDEEALNEARQGSYTLEQIEAVPEPFRQRYFEQNGSRHTFRKDLRRTMIFGRHDLLQDAPISRVDLLACRNTLMYFNAEAQARVLSRFDFALNGGGFLFLGKAEVLLTRGSAFVPVDVKRRIFAKANSERAQDPWLAATSGLRVPSEGSDAVSVRELAEDVGPVAHLVFDAQGAVVGANQQARDLFNVTAGDNRRIGDLASLNWPAELRGAIEKSLSEHRTARLKEVEWPLQNEQRRCHDIVVIPLVDSVGTLLGAKAVVTDVSRARRLREELHRSQQEIETANEELQSSNEELETTNEELQSTVEELETTNEELQSTNEELETMNEELQSTNEELETANTTLRQTSEELNELNAFLESIMAGLRDGVVVLDPSLQVRSWNSRAEDLWGLRADEVRGRHLLTLDIGLPVDQLKPLIRACLNGQSPLEPLALPATNRRGKAITVRVTATRLHGSGRSVQGVILLMEDSRSDGGAA